MSVEPWPDAAPDWDSESDIGTYGSDDDADPQFAAEDAVDDVPGMSVHAGRDIDQSRHSQTVGGDAIHASRDVYLYQVPSGTAEVRAYFKHRYTSAPDLAEQVRPFLPPDGLVDQIATLARTRVLVLLCAADVRRCGQRAAAAFLVHRVGSLIEAPDGLSFQQPILADELQLDEALTEDRHIGLFFDLADADPADAQERLRQFGLLERMLPAAGAYAVIAVADDLEEQVTKSFPGRSHRLAKRPAADVFRHRASDIPESLVDQLLAHEHLRALLGPAWPPLATRLAKITVRVCRSGVDTAAEVIAELDAALSDWSPQIRQDLRRHSTAPARALLLATALLEGSGAAAVVRARNLVLSAARYQPEPVNPLEAPGVVTELAELTEQGLEPEAARFTRPEYGAALLHHVWREHPAVRGVLQRCIDRIPSSMDARLLPDVGVLTERIVTLAAREGDPRVAISVARRWATPSSSTGPGDRRRREAAVRLLTRASLHEGVGSSVRRWLYDGAYDRTASADLRSVIAEVAGQIGAVYPRAAMTRLRHLAAGPETAVTAAVATAIGRVAAGMSLSDLLGHLTGWLGAGPVRAGVAVDAVTHELRSRAAGEAMADGDRSTVIAFWRTAMDVLPADRTAALVQAWLLLDTGEEAGGHTVDVLLDAASGDLRRMGQLLYATRSSNGGVGEGDPLADLFGAVRIRLDELTLMTTDHVDSRKE